MSGRVKGRKRQIMRCRACWDGDCPDCSKWVDPLSKCEHPCDTIPRQMRLPFDSGGKSSSGPANSSPGPDEPNEPWRREP